MFRAYEAEAFIIPTGSMAPTLQGQHMDVVCDQCGYQYRAGATLTSYSYPVDQRADITKTYCPICRHGMKMNPRANADHNSNYGDRILVNKFVYDFQSPERFDVIVFKNPNNGKQNYIKRLVGLPGDNLLIPSP
jgi:signal peptidase I